MHRQLNALRFAQTRDNESKFVNEQRMEELRDRATAVVEQNSAKVCACTQTHTHTRPLAYRYIHTHARTHARTHTHTYFHTQTYV
jgi:hypothetical protein